jgi:uncharacterized protein YbbK (DUF523 family)
MMKERILISACLLGLHCRYDGGHQKISGTERLEEAFTLIPICPEQAGGLSTPRIPCELQNDALQILTGKGRVLNRDNEDCTDLFIKGAREALFLTDLFQIRKALLKEGSPSCGSSRVYDGTFSGTCKPGEGITTCLLRKHGIQVYNENQTDELI